MTKERVEGGGDTIAKTNIFQNTVITTCRDGRCSLCSQNIS